MQLPRVFFGILWWGIIPGLIFAKDYKGAELRTKEAYLYGRFEVRYKAAWGSGLTSTFFTYNDVDPNAYWNEIDIEIMGRYPDDVQFNTITPDRLGHVHHQFVPFDPSLDFHTYAIEWTNYYVAWFVDGREVHRQTGPHIATLRRPQKIMMNIWQPIYEDWAGQWDPAILPAFAYYDYVSYAAYTPGKGNTGTGNNFTLQWVDDFDFWDQDRWQKATHTFQGNNCDFVPENVVFKDGLMILCLTDANHTGFVDKNPPTVLWARQVDEHHIQVQFSEEIDPGTGESISNYTVYPGASVLSAQVLPNGREVILEVDTLISDVSYNLAAVGILDRANPPNRLLAKVTPVIPRNPLTFPIRINVGGDSTAGFLVDQEWSENAEYGYEEGNTGVYSRQLQIADTDMDEIFRSERWGLTRYNVWVPNGSYRVQLLMAENYFDAPGQRIFDVFVEDQLVADNLDVFGKKGKHRAYIMEVPDVLVEDGQINIHFGAERDFALLNGLIIEQIETGMENRSKIPQSFILFPGFPNPFHNRIHFRYFVSQPGELTITVFDLKGRKVSQERRVYASPRDDSFGWHPAGGSGVYFCRFEYRTSTSRTIESRKVLFLR